MIKIIKDVARTINIEIGKDEVEKMKMWNIDQLRKRLGTNKY